MEFCTSPSPDICMVLSFWKWWISEWFRRFFLQEKLTNVSTKGGEGQNCSFFDNLYGRRLISSTSPHSYIKDAFNVQLKVKTEKKRKISTNNCKTKDNLLNTMHEKQKKSRANALRQERQQKADHDWRRTTHDDTWEWKTSLFYFLLNYLTISFI